jgi:sulfide dehydrogenase cytochrome subunit
MRTSELFDFSHLKLPIAAKLFLGFALTIVGFHSFALSVTPNATTVVAGQYQFVTVSNVKGSLSAKSSNPRYATVTKVDESTYRIYGAAPGTVKIEFKDKRSESKVYITVTGVVANNAPNVGSTTGRLLASNCFQCHGTNGSGGFEKLAGESSSEIYKELRKFSNGSEDPNGIMAAHAMGFTDAQMKLIASYFASLR